MGTPSVALKQIGIDLVGALMLGDRLTVALLLRGVDMSLYSIGYPTPFS
jgi:hypothetical protein